MLAVEERRPTRCAVLDLAVCGGGLSRCECSGESWACDRVVARPLWCASPSLEFATRPLEVAGGVGPIVAVEKADVEGRSSITRSMLCKLLDLPMLAALGRGAPVVVDELVPSSADRSPILLSTCNLPCDRREQRRVPEAFSTLGDLRTRVPGTICRRGVGCCRPPAEVPAPTAALGLACCEAAAPPSVAAEEEEPQAPPPPPPAKEAAPPWTEVAKGVERRALASAPVEAVAPPRCWRGELSAVERVAPRGA